MDQYSHSTTLFVLQFVGLWLRPEAINPKQLAS